VKHLEKDSGGWFLQDILILARTLEVKEVKIKVG
jgi:hypothetical protein